MSLRMRLIILVVAEARSNANHIFLEHTKSRYHASYSMPVEKREARLENAAKTTVSKRLARRGG